MTREAGQPPKMEHPVASRRFYTSVALDPVPGGGFGILLDGRPVKTPKKVRLVAPAEPFASRIADEWRAQGEQIRPATMPATRMANSAIDVVTANADAIRGDIVAYAMSDALCYRAENPADLASKQAAAWNPLLAWAERALDARFLTTAGIVHRAQPDATRDAVAAAVTSASPWPLAALHVVTTLTGSAILALAVRAGELTAEQAWTLAHVDEDHQIALWGEDFEAVERRTRRWLDMDAACFALKTFR